MENTCSASDTGAAASVSEPPTGTDTTSTAPAKCDQENGQKSDGGAILEVSVGDGKEGVEEEGKEVEKDVVMGGGGDLEKEDQQEKEAVEEREHREQEEVEEVKQLVKEGTESLLPVLGEEVTAKVDNDNFNSISLLSL